MAAMRSNATSDGTVDFNASTRPEVNAKTLDRPEFSINLPQNGSSRAPIAKLLNPPRSPVLKLDTNIRIITKSWYPPFKNTAGHDYYSERFALSPEDRPKMFAGPHYTDKHALSPEETFHDYFEALAHWPVRDDAQGQESAGRGRMESGPNRAEAFDFIIVATPNGQPEAASTSEASRGKAPSNKAEGCPTERAARG
jgi:hypothetical protein